MPNINKKEVNSTLRQHLPLLGENRYFEIYNNKFIKVTRCTVFKQQNFHLNLSLLTPWPVQQQKIAWAWLIVTLCFALLSFYCFANTSSVEQITQYFPLYIFTSFSSLLIFLYRSQRVVQFKSRYGNCVLLHFFYNQSNKKELKNFIEEIKLRSLTASQEMTMDVEQMLEIEAEELKKLYLNKSLKKRSYMKAIQRIKKFNRYKENR